MSDNLELGDFAEAPLAWIPPEDGGVVDNRDPRFILQHSSVSDHGDFGAVVRVRLSNGDLDRALNVVRDWFAQRGRQRYSWQVRESRNPPGTVDALLERGLHRHPAEVNGYTAMMTRRVPSADPAIEVRRAITVSDHLAGVDILIKAFGIGVRDGKTMRERVGRRGDRAVSHMSTYLAYLDGEPAARGTVLFAPNGSGALYAGATLQHARGRGLHRALVAARFTEVDRRGGDGVVVLAGRHSRSGFEALGFQTVDTVTWLYDTL